MVDLTCNLITRTSSQAHRCQVVQGLQPQAAIVLQLMRHQRLVIRHVQLAWCTQDPRQEARTPSQARIRAADLSADLAHSAAILSPW